MNAAVPCMEACALPRVVVILDGAAFYSLPEGSLRIAPDCRHSAGRIPALHILGRYVMLLQSHIQM